MKRLGMALGLGAAMIGACGGTAAAQHQIQLTVWSDTERLGAFDAYRQAHPDIDLTVVTVAPSDLVAKLQLALRARSDVPDAIFMSSLDYVNMLSTRRSNYLLELSDLVSQDVFDGFLPNANTPCVVDGRVLCMRNDIAHNVLWYNRPLMDELGLDVPETWEAFEQLGADLAARGEGHFIGAGTEPWPMISFLAAGGCDVGFPVVDRDNTISVDLTSDDCVRMARMLDRMLENGSLMASGAFEPALVNAAKQGRLVMFYGPTWFGEHVMRAVYEFEPGTVAAALPPRWSDHEEPLTWSWGGGAFGGWRGTEHPQEVADLLVWMTTDIGLQVQAVTMPAHQPASQEWGKAINADPYYVGGDVYDVSEAAAAFSHPSYGGLRFDRPAAYAKIVGPAIATGGSIVGSLAALQEELVNAARVADYDVVQ